MIKRFFAIVFVLAFGVVNSYAEDSKWVGIWNSNKFNYTLSGSNAKKGGDVKMSCEYYLFSDGHSYTNITLYFNMSAEGLKCSVESLMSCPGDWFEEGNKLGIIPEIDKATNTVLSVETVIPDVYKGQRLSAYEKSLLESQLNKELASYVKGMLSMKEILDNDGEIPIEAFKKMGM